MGDTAARKGDARNDRLTLRKTNEEVLRKKLSIEAQNICAEECKQFGECAVKSGLMVVFNCRSQNLASKYLFSCPLEREHCSYNYLSSQ